MSYQRFTVDRAAASMGPGQQHVVGWAVFHWGARITHPFATREEALERCRRIAALYLRYGW